MLDRVMFISLGLSIGSFTSLLFDLMGIENSNQIIVNIVLFLAGSLLVDIAFGTKSTLRFAALTGGAIFILLFLTLEPSTAISFSSMMIIKLVFGMVTGGIAILLAVTGEDSLSAEVEND